MSFATERAALFADDSVVGPAFGRAYADLVDEWLATLVVGASGDAVVAVGG